MNSSLTIEAHLITIIQTKYPICCCYHYEAVVMEIQILKSLNTIFVLNYILK